jgi:Putative auto-transporter adhesin, head GIN domain
MLPKVKKSKLAAALIAALLLSSAVSACGGVSISKDGPHAVRSRNVAPYSRIEIRGSTEVIVKPGRGHTLRLEGGINRIRDLHTRVEGHTLVVEQDDTSAVIDLGGDPARVVAEAPRIEGVRIDGSGKVYLGRQRGTQLATSIYGSGEVRADGWVDRLRSRVDGSGTLHLTALRAEDAAVAMSGSGSAELGAIDRLDADIDGSASVFYAGDPALTEDVSGSGRVERR